jgi:prepilin-type N-terminal cleavage/methylation domain-containing protein
MRRGRTSGFTLVETMVALLLMALVMLAIVPLFATSLKSNGAGQDFTILNTLAKQQLEQAMQYSFTDPRLAVPSGATVSIVNQDGTTTTSSGQLYQNQLATTVTDGTKTISFPYELDYIVQNFPMTSVGSAAVPDPATAVDDANAAWITSSGAKLITVFVASSREAIQGTSYKTASGVLPATLKGKQIRMTAMKMP